MNINPLSIPANEYHAESRNGHYMSSHLLADLRESPELYHRKTTGQIEDAESAALAIGRAIPVVASLLGPPLRGYQTFRFTSFASATSPRSATR